MRGRAPLIPAFAITVLGLGALGLQVSFSRSERLDSLPSAWRFWDDLALGIGRYVDATSAGERMEGAGPDLSPLVTTYAPLVIEKVRTFRVRPYEFWRTVPDQKFRTLRAPFSAAAFEDAGRGQLLAWGFRLLGGVAPYLLLWLGVLFFAPVWMWLNYELLRAGWSVAALVLTGLLSLSPYTFEILTLPHSAAGFYFGALAGVAAFAVAILRFPPPFAGVVIRSILLISLILMAVWCRGGSVFFLPVAFGLVWIALRTGGGCGRGAALVTALALVVMPAVVLRPSHAHNVWLSLWEGLGDFVGDRGYSWYDADANAFLRSRGVAGFSDPKFVTVQHEAAFREALVGDLVRSPWWFCGILLKRTIATVAMTKLAPWGPRDGESKSAPYFHYKYTTPIDWFGWRGRLIEVPVSALWAPTLLLLVWNFWGRCEPAHSRILSAVALAALPVPVLMSTAGALETQAFGLTYFIGASFLAQRIAGRLVQRKPVPDHA